MVVASPNQPGFDLINQGVVDFAEENDLEGVSILEDPPFADPAGFAQRLVGGRRRRWRRARPRLRRCARRSSSRAWSTR